METAAAMDVTLDGEIRTHTPVFVRVAPQQVRVLSSPQAKYLLMQDKQSDGSGYGYWRRAEMIEQRKSM